jgi:hypothetical protein
MYRQIPRDMLNYVGKRQGGGVVPLKEGDRMTLLEAIALLMLIIAVVNLVLNITKKK